MALLVNTGSTLSCTFGTATTPFKATNNPTVLVDGKPAGSIVDGDANVNITPFGMCTTLSNPAVAAATAAALGVLTPQPCTPQTKAWTTETATVLIGGKPCLTQGCQCMCAYGGTISVTDSAQKTVIIT